MLTTLGFVAGVAGLTLVPFDRWANLLGIALTWLIAIWGLRQKPGFHIERSRPSRTLSKCTAKYQNSALTPDHSRLIADKIAIAMERDRLYRDPNISLWDLAKHISVTSNYVSQTLNETIGETFFDYLNKWRIKDAVHEIQTTDQTMLAIAYDVGLNARSSFYKAFKKEMGTTPLAMKRQRPPQSARAPNRG